MQSTVQSSLALLFRPCLELSRLWRQDDQRFIAGTCRLFTFLLLFMDCCHGDDEI